MAKTEKSKKLRLSTMVWICRIIVGATFVISGWSKSVDPWGFLYKLEEYFNVWSIEIPREISLAFVFALSVCEFTVGILILTGAMRRASVIVSGVIMAVMLPLTVYIAVANPVSDCGCFGDFIVLSNTATLLKNIILVILIVILYKYNHRVGGIYSLNVQWLAMTGAILFSFTLAYIGYRYQPLVDFRPFGAGTLIYKDADDADHTLYIYEKNGLTRTFALDNLPDSTWTFVKADSPEQSATDSRLAVFDGDDDVTEEVLDEKGERFILVIADTDIHYLTRARLANELYEYIRSRGGDMIALVAAEGARLEEWRQLALPSFPVYSAEDTQLKELVRGDAGLVFLRHGKIVWKRNLASVSHDAIKAAGGDLEIVDIAGVDSDREMNICLTGAFLIWLLLLCCFKKNS